MPINYETACETEKNVLCKVYTQMEEYGYDCGDWWNCFGPKDLAPASRTMDEWSSNHEEWLMEGLGGCQKKWLKIAFFDLLEAEEGEDGLFVFYNRKTEELLTGEEWSSEYYESDFDDVLDRNGSDWTFWFFRFSDIKEAHYELLKDRENEVDNVEMPNIWPYKLCSKCKERESCGNYTDEKVWLCEGCGEPDIIKPDEDPIAV
jgi:rubrerythrin